MGDTINDTSRNDAAERDQARHTLSAEETSVIFAEAGVPRSVRTVQRYCKKGHLACITVDTEISEKYLIDQNSVERRIKELQQLDRVLRSQVVATSREETRHDAAERGTSRHDGSEDTAEKIAECPASAPLRQIGHIEQGRVSGSSEPPRSEDETETRNAERAGREGQMLDSIH